MSYHKLNKNKNWNPKRLEITNYIKNHIKMIRWTIICSVSIK